MPAEPIQGITIIYCNQFTVPAANPLNPQGNYGAHKEGDAVRSQNHGFTSGHRAGHAQTGQSMCIQNISNRCDMGNSSEVAAWVGCWRLTCRIHKYQRPLNGSLRCANKRASQGAQIAHGAMTTRLLDLVSIETHVITLLGLKKSTCNTMWLVTLATRCKIGLRLLSLLSDHH